MIAKYKKLFRVSPEAGAFAIFGFVQVLLWQITSLIEQVKVLLHCIGIH